MQFFTIKVLSDCTGRYGIQDADCFVSHDVGICYVKFCIAAAVLPCFAAIGMLVCAADAALRHLEDGTLILLKIRIGKMLNGNLTGTFDNRCFYLFLHIYHQLL